MSGISRRRTGGSNLELARRIRAAGVPIHIEEDEDKSARTFSDRLLIEQFGAETESRAFDFCGGAGFICWLTITTLRPRIAISAFVLELPWTTEVQWLQPIASRYEFGGRDSLGFDEDQVLNHYADLQRRPLGWGTTIQGCLLGIGTEAIPHNFVHGASIPAMLTVMDQYRGKSVSPVSFWADRSHKNTGVNPLKPRRRRLFECPDSRPFCGR
jgi:hypothetical protein